MKKRSKSLMLLIVMLVLLSTVFTLAACDDPARKEYTATFELGEYSGQGAAPAPVKAKKDAEITLPDVGVVWEGHEFTGWKLDNDVKNAGAKHTMTADVTFVAQWRTTQVQPSTVTVTYEPGFSELTAEQQAAFDAAHPDGSVNEGADVTLTAVGIEREGYTFDGWDVNGQAKNVGDVVQADDDLTITAKWTPNPPATVTVTVTYEPGFTGLTAEQQAAFDAAHPDGSVNEGADVTLTAVGIEREGYTFDGWDVNGQAKNVGDVVQADDDLTITAKWLEQYEVTVVFVVGAERRPQQPFVVNEGSALSTAHAAVLSNPSVEGYDFQGWYVDNSQIADINAYVPTGDVTIEARFQIKTFTVTFTANDTQFGDTQTVEYGGHANAPTETPVHDTLTFHYWRDAVSGEQFDFETTEIKANITIDALFEVLVKYELGEDYAGDGQAPEQQWFNLSKNIPQLRSFTLPAVGATWDGYEFTGWKVKGDLSDTVYKENASFANDEYGTMLAKSVTFVAQWRVFEEDVYDVTYDLTWRCEDTPPEAERHKAGTSFNLPSGPFTPAEGSEKFEFKGWYVRNNSGTVYAPGVIFEMPANAVEFVAKWEEKKEEVVQYNVTFEAGTHGQGSMDPVQVNETQYELPACQFTSDSEWFYFAGWAVKNGDPIYGDYYTLTGDVTFVAQWSSAGMAYSVTDENMLIIFNDVTASGDGILYPNYEEETFVEFTYTVNAQEIVITIQGNECIGTINGWDAVYEAPFIDIDVTIEYNGAQYVFGEGSPAKEVYWKVTFMANGAQFGEIQTVKDGETVARPQDDPTDEISDSTFHYWEYQDPDSKEYVEYDFQQPVTSNLTISAKFEIRIDFENGGATGDLPEAIWTSMTKKVTIPGQGTLVNGDMTFDGWKEKNGAQTYQAEQQVTFRASTTLVAQWKEPEAEVTFTVEYAADYGAVGEPPAQPFTVKQGESVTLLENTYTKSGYKFAGWTIQHYVEETTHGSLGQTQTEMEWKAIEGEENKPAGYVYYPTENIIIKATFVRPTVVIKYMPNGGEGNIDDKSVDYNSNIPLPAESFTAPAGKVFRGWSLSVDGALLSVSGSGKILWADVQDSVVPQENGDYTLTLYAIWEDIPVQVADIAGVYTYNGNTVIISTEGAGEIGDYGEAVGSIIADNEFMLLYRNSVQRNNFYAHSMYSPGDVYIVEAGDGQIVIDENVYTGKVAIQNADISEFEGTWNRTGTSQKWVINADKTAQFNDTIDASRVAIVDKYLVLEYEQSYATYQFVLYKEGDNLVGWFIQPEKIAISASFEPDTATPEPGPPEPEIPAGDYYLPQDGAVATYQFGSVTKKSYVITRFSIEGTTLHVFYTIDGGDEQSEDVTMTTFNWTDGTYPEGNRTNYRTSIAGNQMGLMVYESGDVYFVDDNSEEIVTNNHYVKQGGDSGDPEPEPEPEPERPAGDLYVGTSKYVTGDYTFDEFVVDVANNKIYAYYTYNDKSLMVEATSVRSQSADWAEKVDGAKCTNYYYCYVAVEGKGQSIEIGVAVYDDGTLRLLNTSSDASIDSGNNHYVKQA